MQIRFVAADGVLSAVDIHAPGLTCIILPNKIYVLLTPNNSIDSWNIQCY